LSTANCTGPCAIGYQCSAGSNSSQPTVCSLYKSCAALSGVCGSVLDPCNNALVPCGPPCGVPTVVAATVQIDVNDLTQPIRLLVSWNQTIHVRQTAGAHVANLSLVSLQGSSADAAQTILWPELVPAEMGQTVRPVSPVNASLLGCTRYSLDAGTADWLPGNASVVRRSLAPADATAMPPVWQCHSNKQITLPSTLATLYNLTTLVLDVPAPLYRANATYQVILPAEAFCSRVTPVTCASSFSLLFVTPVDPWNYLIPLALTSIGASSARALTVSGRPEWNASTLQLNHSDTSINVTFASTALPSGVPVGFIVPADIDMVRQALPTDATTFVGGNQWFNTPATRFQDRLVLHPDASLTDPYLPVRFLPGCAFGLLVDAAAVSVACGLPANATGSLWRIYVGWAVRLPDGALLLPRQLSLLPWRSSTGAPLTLSFAMSTLTPGTARRFPANAQGIRTVALPFSFTPPQNSPDNAQGQFDVSSMTLSLSSPPVSALQAIETQSAEPLFVLGRVYLPCPTLDVYLGGPGATVTQSCMVNQATDTWLICTTSALPGGSLGIGLPLWLWDTASLVVAPSPDTYSYAYSPTISALVGCLPRGPDSSDVLVWAPFCPCAGNVTMTVTGANLFPPLTVLIGSIQVAPMSIAVVDTTNYTRFTFVLPAGSGVGLTLSVTSGTKTSLLPNAASYRLPSVFGLKGCASNATVSEVTNCRRKGGDVLTLIGQDFGPAPPSVIVAGVKCVVRNASQSSVTCTLAAMPIGHALGNQVLVVQSTGGILFVDVATAAVSYRQCIPGQQEAGLNCSICPVGTFSAAAGSLSCSPCTAGTIGPAMGLSSCVVCFSGQYSQDQATTCSLCAPGKYSLSGAGVCSDCGSLEFAPFAGMSKCSNCPTFSTGAQPTGASACLCNPQYELQNGECVACPAGTQASPFATTAASRCMRCPVGKFSVTPAASSCDACAPGKYSAQTGMTDCATCTASTATSAAGASACTCLESFYSVGSSNGSSTLCAPCPTGALCGSLDPLRTTDTLRSLPGQWRVAEHKPPLFLKCQLNPTACLSTANGSCAVGYEGPMCGVCSPGYHLSSRACELCSGSVNAYLLPVLTLILVALVALFVFISRRINLTKLVGAAKLTVSYLQVMGSSSSTYQIPWPDFLQGLLTSFRLALMDVMQVLAVDCWRHLTFYDGFLLTTVTTSVLLALVPLLHRLAPRVVARWFPQHGGATLTAFRHMLVKCLAIFVRVKRCKC
jgi:hypothetical protein